MEYCGKSMPLRTCNVTYIGGVRTFECPKQKIYVTAEQKNCIYLYLYIIYMYMFMYITLFKKKYLLYYYF